MLDRPQDMPDAFRAAWMARDAGALAGLFAPDADFVNVVGLWWRDREAIRAAHHRGLSTFFARSTLKIGRVRLRHLSEAAAVVHARMILSGQTAPDGTLLPDRRTVISFVMARTGSGWHCVSAQNTDIHDGSETMAPGPGGLEPTDYR